MLYLYDTLSREKKEFKPLRKNRVSMYVCGLTPYDNSHIGHARTYVAFDSIRRLLLFQGFEVFFIQNITDVDDKILNRAREKKLHPLFLADYFQTKAMLYFSKLNILPASIYPRVSQNISEIIEVIKSLIERGYAYEAKTGVYFDVDKFKSYGKLSGQGKEELKKHRVEPDPAKKNVYDFALWKKSKNEEIEWQSPWGMGRPGWHIECSAMCSKYAHETLDIHGGAKDLIFPHHENEIAQSESYSEKKLANFWIHTGFLTVNNVKMSKSLGNFITIKDALKNHSPMGLRLFFLLTKYSSPLDYSEKEAKSAEEGYEKLCFAYSNAVNSLQKANSKKDDFKKTAKQRREAFIKSLEDDFDTPRAIAELFGFARELNSYISSKQISKDSLNESISFFNDAFYILGLKKPKKKTAGQMQDNLIKLIIKLRNSARDKKLYELSDEIRKELLSIGIELSDSKESTSYSLAKK